MRLSILFATCLILSSCSFNKSNGVMLTKIDRYAQSDSIKMDSLLSAIPDSLLLTANIWKGHTYNCVMNVCYLKAAQEIKTNRRDEAQKLLRHVVNLAVLQCDRIRGGDMFYIKTDMADAQNHLDMAHHLYSLFVIYNDEYEKAHHNDVLKQLLIEQLQSVSKEMTVVHKAQEQYWLEEIICSHKYYWSLVIIVGITLAFLVLYDRNTNEYSNHLNDSLKQQSRLKERIDQLKAQISDKEHEVAQLYEQSQQLREATNLRLGIGNTIYDRVKSGGLMKNISIEEEQCFIDYYAFAYPQEYLKIISLYKNLSLRHTTYLILLNMGFKDVEIQKILFVKSSTVRNYRSRMNKNRV